MGVLQINAGSLFLSLELEDFYITMASHTSVIARASAAARFNEFVVAIAYIVSSTTTCGVHQDGSKFIITCNMALPEKPGFLVTKSCSSSSGILKCSNELTKPFYTGNLTLFKFINDPNHR